MSSHPELGNRGADMEETPVSPDLKLVPPLEPERTVADDRAELAQLQSRLDRKEIGLDSPEFDRYTTLKGAMNSIDRDEEWKKGLTPSEVEAAENFEGGLTPSFTAQRPEPGNPSEVSALFEQKMSELQALNAKPAESLTPAEADRRAVLEKISVAYEQFKQSQDGMVTPSAERTEAESIRQKRLAEDVTRLRTLSDGAFEAMHQVNKEALARLEAAGRGQEIEGRLTKETLDAYAVVQAERQAKTETATIETPPEAAPESVVVVDVEPSAIIREPISVLEPAPELPTIETTTPEHIETTEKEPELPTVDKARAAYAEALHKRTKIFGRTSDAVLEQTATAYQEALAREQASSLETLKAEFADQDLSNPEVQTRLQGRMVETILTNRQAEENALRESFMDVGERSRFGKFKQLWKRHAKLRMAGSLALMGLSAVSLATGNVALFAGSQAARTGLSGLSTGMAVESGMDFARDKWGDTKKMSAEDIQNLDRAELERRLAGQLVRSAELGQGKDGQPLSETTQLLQEAYTERNRAALLAAMNEQLAAGKTWAEVTNETFIKSMQDQVEFHRSLETRRTQDRKHKLRKLATAFGAGAAAGIFAGLSGADKTSDLIEAKAQAVTDHGLAAAADSTHVATHPEVTGSVGSLSERAHEVAAPADSTHVATHPEVTGSVGSLSEITQEVAAKQGAHTVAAEMAGQSAAESAAEHSAVEVVQKGDNLWSVVERELHERMGNSFDGLDEARKTYMIDALKDKIADDPTAFGLEDIDHLHVGDKIDLTKLFESQDALTEIRTDALGLNQDAVDSILKNNELLREWVSNNPHEALNSEVAESVLRGELPTSIAEAPGAENAVSELSAYVNEQWVQKTHEEMMKRLLCNLSEQFPEEYARAHAANPEMYPDIAGTIPDAETIVIKLTESGAKAFGKYTNLVEGLYDHAGKDHADAIVKSIGELRVDQATKAGYVERMVDTMAGGDAKTAKNVGRTLRSLLKALPKGEYLNSEKVSDVLERLPKK